MTRRDSRAGTSTSTRFFFFIPLPLSTTLSTYTLYISTFRFYRARVTASSVFIYLFYLVSDDSACGGKVRMPPIPSKRKSAKQPSNSVSPRKPRRLAGLRPGGAEHLLQPRPSESEHRPSVCSALATQPLELSGNCGRASNASYRPPGRVRPWQTGQ